ncbi:tripartite motif-containing protein 35-like [Myripristis murdjan]|uniref:tripartite motif-containing protein 35-like n=1 Tax=Myripristis murdjan TaxID=586833 RepID=UPI001175EB60|nr:tripartite motif-containing protein 35-like [Myripristis murdjan]
MASASYMEDLTCSVCLTIFTDSVSLLCGHFFCRKCITNSLSKKDQCPQCQTTVPKEEKYLPTNHILKSLADKTKEAEKIKREQGDETTGVAQFLCPEHEEKLKLFCETDQQLACIICRDGERHNGHKFKPIREAATSLRQELEKGMEHLSDEIHAIESLASIQREEITKTHMKSQELMTQINTQFEEIHQFQRQREEEIKNELKEKEREAVEEMTEKLQAMDLVLSESRELQVKVTAALEISDSVKFLQSWTEVNNMLTPECLFRPRANDLPVARASLSLGPYESNLQFFVWKDMVQVVKPRAGLLSLRRENTDVTVSDDGHSLLCSPKSSQSQPGALSGSHLYHTSNNAFKTSLFGSAQLKNSFEFGSAQPKNSFTFGSAQPKNSFTIGSTQPKNSFTFGSTQPKNSFTFGSAQPKHCFTFGSAQPKNSFQFGSAQPKNTFEFASAQPKNSFTFGSAQPKNSFPFGSAQPKNSFTFGSAQPKNSFPFGSAQPKNTFEFASAQPKNSFTFGSAQPKNPFEFGSAQPKNSFTFGSAQPKNSFPFGSGQPKNPFEFGSAQPKNSFPFGSAQNENSSTFGSAQPKNPFTFGSAQPKNSFPFGSAQPNNSFTIGSAQPRNSFEFGSTAAMKPSGFGSPHVPPTFGSS